MEFADYPGLNGELAADFQARHFMRRDTHVGYDSLSSFPPYNAAALAGLAVDVKPRLTKEQHDVLENEFQKQSKPNTNTKKRFAEVLGVSLDKVNNWFQNRRAKSKQDAKKQAGAFNLLQASHSQQSGFPSINAINSISSEDISPTYCPQDSYNDLRDDGPMSNGLGIQNGAQPHMVTPNFSMPMGLTMQKQRSQHQHPANQEPEERGRRTLTQAQFDAFGQTSPYTPTTHDHTMGGMSATINGPADLYGQYDFPDLCDFNFETADDAPITAEPMEPSHSSDSWQSNAMSPSAKPASLNLRLPRNNSSRSDSTAPSVSITPANQEESGPFEYGLANLNHSSQSVSSQPASWQPGTSIPVDLATLQQEFQDAAMHHRTQSVPSIPHHPFLDQPPMAFPIEGQFRQDASTAQLARSMQNFSMQTQRAAMPSSTIAARRQRPKPAPLGINNTRSTSFGGRANTSPTRIPSGGQALRRVKSSQTMNGTSGGRIQKNISSTQRSPSAATFAAPHRLARRVSSFSPGFAGIPPLPITSVGLAPPTPLSPSSYANMQAVQGSNTSDSDGDGMNHVLSASNFSPPTTPIYASQFSRRGTVAGDDTPPQSAPAMQQSFSNTGFSTTSSQSPMTSVPMLQSQSHGFVSMMPNDYSPVGFPSQQQAIGGQFMEMPMSYIMTSNGEVHMGYQVIPPFAQHMHQQGTPPNTQHPFLSSSNSSPGTMMSSQVSKHHQPAADFFVHEYTPPQDVKQTPATSPRKATDGGPKNYTFTNHGPEYFERSVKKLADDASPDSSAEEEITG